jgi:hypothetical protein
MDEMLDLSPELSGVRTVQKSV